MVRLEPPKPREGTETTEADILSERTVRLEPPKPREGTETERPNSVEIAWFVRTPLILERGRKQIVLALQPKPALDSPRKNPQEGTETEQG